MARNMETGGQRIFPTFQQIGDNLSNTGTSIVNSLPNKNELTKALRDPEFYSDVGSRAKNMFTSMHPMDQVALTTAPFPILGDVTGLAADARMFSQEPESRTPLNFGLSALGALPFIPAAATIKAFHGTPHKVDKFSMDNIGTGEGAQAYGHGLYFAESEDVAKQYQRQLTDYKSTFDGMPVTGSEKLSDLAEKLNVPIEDAEGIRRLAITSFNDPQKKGIQGAIKTQQDLIQDAQGSLSKVRSLELKQDIKEWQTALDSAEKYGDRIQDAQGNLYNVNLNVNPEDLLDWDAPLSDKKRELFRGMFEERLKSGDRIQRGQAEHALNTMFGDTRPTGRQFYHQLSGASKEETSKLLSESGVKGIQYYDGMSRGAGEGTKNYVMFDDNLIDIVDPIDDIVNKHNAALDSVK